MTSSSVQSRLALRFDAESGRTVARLQKQQPPWKVLRSFLLSCGGALVHVHNVSGGVLDRDNLSLAVNVGAGAAAQVTSTGATRIYRSRSEQNVARQSIEATVKEGGCLEYLPDPLIPYAGSRFSQCSRVRLGPGAALFWWETIAPGRIASGERFAFADLASEMEIRCGQELIACERWRLEPQKRPMESLARAGPFLYLSTFYICLAEAEPRRWRALEEQLGAIADGLSRPAEVLWGVSTLVAHGLVVRGAGRNGRELTSGLVRFWQCAKLFLLGRVAELPRKTY